MSNKENAKNFFKMIFARKVREAYDTYVAPDFKHHNQWFPGDRESLLKGMEEAHNEFPDSKVNYKHVFEDGEFVITHAHVEHTPEQSFSATHIFKFRDGKIVELWDAAWEIDKNSPNKNGPFKDYFITFTTSPSLTNKNKS